MESFNNFGSKKWIHRKKKRVLRIRIETSDFDTFTARLADLSGVTFWEGKYQTLKRATEYAGAAWMKMMAMTPKEIDSHVVPNGKPLVVTHEDLNRFIEWDSQPKVKRNRPGGEHRGDSGDHADDESAEVSGQHIPEKDLANGKAKG